MNKSEIVKIRINPQRKEAWQEYAESCFSQLTVTQLVTIAVDYFVSGQYYKDSCNTFNRSLYTDAWSYPRITEEDEYFRKFLNDAKIESERKREKKEKLTNEYKL